MSEDELIAVIDAELRRQAQDDRPDTPCLHNRFGDEQGIDGHVNLRQLAKAILDPTAHQRTHAPAELTPEALMAVAAILDKQTSSLGVVLALRPPASFTLDGIMIDGVPMPRLRIEGRALEQVQQRVREKLGQPAD